MPVELRQCRLGLSLAQPRLAELIPPKSPEVVQDEVQLSKLTGFLGHHETHDGTHQLFDAETMIFI